MNFKRRILLTVYTEEGFHVHVEGQNFTKKRPYEHPEFGGEMVKGRFPDPRDYISVKNDRVRISTLSEEVVHSFTTDDSAPKHKCNAKFEWKKWSPKRRLEYNLEAIAEGKPFTYEFIGD